MTKIWKRSTAVLVWCCLSCSARAQLVPDSTQLRPQVAGQSFPFRSGVALELGLYRQLRQQEVVVEQLLASKEERLRTLNAQLQLTQTLYADCTQRLRAVEAASARQAATLAALARADSQPRARPAVRSWQVLLPATAGALLIGLLVGTAAR